jgi:cytochrome c biogenesis protein CcdA
MWSLPSFLRAPDTTRGDSASFFALGVFSGIASSCCAPVLAGVMTLSVLSGSPIGGFTLGVAYVFGMVFPLFVMALLWDKAKLGEKKFLRAKAVRFRVAGRLVITNTLNVAVAIAFVVMGAFVIALAGSANMTGGTAPQAWASSALTDVFSRVQTFLSPVPEPILGVGILALAALFVWATLSDRRLPWRRAGSTESAEDDDEHAACHATSSSTTASHDKERNS